MVAHYLTHVFPNGFKAQVVATSRAAVALGELETSAAVVPLGPLAPDEASTLVRDPKRARVSKMKQARGRRRKPSAIFFCMDIFRSDAALTIGGAGEGNLGRIARDKILDFDRIPDRVDVGIARQQMFIHTNAAAWTDFQTRIDREFVLGSNSNPQDDQLGR